MASDDQRREVAKRMREIMRRYPHGFLDNMVAQSVLDVMGEGVTIGETVADLIDPPTCHLVDDEDGRTACSECGCTDPCMLNARFCPDCGSRVVYEEDDDD